MNVQHRDERQSADAVTGRAPEALDRWEDEGGATSCRMKETIMAGIGNYKMTDALRRPRSPGGEKGSTPKRQHEIVAQQTREAQERGEARGAVPPNRDRMVDIGRGTQQAGRQGQ